MSQNTLYITIELVSANEADSNDGRQHPACDQGQDHSGAGHDGVVLQGGGDVQEPLDEVYLLEYYENIWYSVSQNIFVYC